MKKRICFLLIISQICFIITSSSQTPEWSRLIQETTYGVANFGFLISDDEHVITAGIFSGPLTYDGQNLTSTGLRDLLIVKTSGNATTEWIKQINSYPGGIAPTGLATDINGNIYFTANYTGIATIGSYTFSGTSNFIAKLDENGNVIWATPFTSSGTGKCQLIVDNYGNCYHISFTSKLIKFSQAGQILWEQIYPQNTLQSLTILGNRLFLGGILRAGSTTFGSITKDVSYKSGYIMKATLDGVFLDSLIFYGSPNSSGSLISDLKSTETGHILMAGGYSQNLILQDFALYQPAQGGYNFIAKFDSAFSRIWIRSGEMMNFPNLTSFRLSSDNAGNIYESGTVQNGFMFGEVYVPSPNFYLKFDQEGNPILSNVSTDPFSGFTVTPSGKVLATGTYGLDNTVFYNNIYLRQFSADNKLEWQKISLNSQTGNVKINYAIHDPEGNIYSSARITGYCNYFGTVIRTNVTKTVLAKHDHEGKIKWVRQIDDIVPQSTNYPFGPCLALDPENNLLTIGKFQTILNLGTTTFLNSNETDDGYVARFDSEGGLTWAVQLHSENDINIHGITADTNGCVIISGEFKSRLAIGTTTLNAGGLDAVFIVKLNKDGTLLWARGYPIGDVVYLAMPGTDGDNNIYVAGEMYNRAGQVIAFGDKSTPQTNSDGGTVLVRFSPEGVPLWVHTYGGVPGGEKADGWPCDIKTDKDGNAYLWGWCYHNAVFGSTTLSNPFVPKSSNYFYYLTKINPTGEVIWANAVYEKWYGFNYGDMLDLDDAGNIYAGGHFRDSIDISGNRYKPTGPYDNFTIKYNNAGAFQWVKMLTSNAIIINSLSVLKNNSVTIAGQAGTEATMGTFPVLRKGGATTIIATMGDLPFLSVSDENIYFKTVDNPKPVQINSNTEWKVVSDQPWLVPDKTSGTGNLTLNLTPMTNEDLSTRTAVLTIRGTGIPAVVIHITQSGTTGTVHFIPIWEGNGTDQMNINVYAALLDSLNLESGDEIGLFDGEMCVGAGLVSGTISTGNVLKIVASADEGIGNGFTPGDSIFFRIYDKSQNKEFGLVMATYNNSNPFWSADGKFLIGATAFVRLEGFTASTLTISLSKGWNILSFNTNPPNPEIKGLFRPLIDDKLLLKVQDETGKSLEDYGIFGGWVNNIGLMMVSEGYKVKTANICNLGLTGIPVRLPYTITLKTGWNIMGYPRNGEADGKAVVQQLIERGKLIKVQDEKGSSIEDWGIFGGWVNNIGNFKPGEGYKIKVSGDETLTINASYPKSAVSHESLSSLESFEFFKPVNMGNGVDHMNINLVNIPEGLLQPGDEIAVFDGNLCVGAFKFTVHSSQFTVQSSQSTEIRNLSIAATASDDMEGSGFTEGNSIILKLWKASEKKEYILEPEIIRGTYTFVKQESTFASLKNLMIGRFGDLEMDGNIGINWIKIFPNPTTGKVYISASRRTLKGMHFQVINSLGQIILSRNMNSNSCEIDLSGNTRGVYYIKVTHDSFTWTEKLILR